VIVQDDVLKEAHITKPMNTAWYSCIFNLEPLSNWGKVVWNLHDDQIQKINGTDYTLYLVYLRYAAWICTIITLINLVFIIPLYAGGEPKPVDDWGSTGQSSMNRFTLLNITATEWKFNLIYVFSLIVVSSLAYAMVIF
jgi:hypothetical protein